MKKLFCLLLPLIFIGSLNAQERFTVPERTTDQKLNTVIYQSTVSIQGGINYAKSTGLTPYEYGKYIGDLFAPSWNPDGGFDALVNTAIRVWDSYKSTNYRSVIIKEMEDGSVIIDFPKAAMEIYFPDDSYASLKEYLEYLNGIFDPIASYMGCSIKINTTEESVEYIVKELNK